MLGGIASGKSEVARAFAGEAGEVLDADRLAHEVLAEPEVREWIARRFGAACVGGGGIDRAALAERVFADPAARTELEARVHPVVRERLRQRLAAARARGVPRIALDVPLLLENAAAHGLDSECDALIFVDADARVREARALARRGWKPGELARREAAQLPLERKRARADFVVRNDGDLEHLRAQVASIVAALARRRAAH